MPHPMGAMHEMGDAVPPRQWAPVKGPTILLSTGRYFSFEHPSTLTVQEVAHALSKLCRFTGQCRSFYSVAQHSVLVSRLVPPEFAWEALHHDDVEAVVGDMSSPLKRLIPAFKVIEHRCEKPILAGFGIDADAMSPSVKHADLVALRTEQRDLMVPRGEVEGRLPDGVVWTDLEGIEPSPAKIYPVLPDIAEQMFLDRYWELARMRGPA
jgi:hypothetical protein